LTGEETEAQRLKSGPQISQVLSLNPFIPSPEHVLRTKYPWVYALNLQNVLNSNNFFCFEDESDLLKKQKIQSKYLL